MDSLKAEKLSREERVRRVRVEHECNEAIKIIREYKANIESLISRYLTENINAFHKAFDLGDIDGFISGANAITEKLGDRVQFRNMKEFDDFMDSNEAFVLYFN